MKGGSGGAGLGVGGAGSGGGGTGGAGLGGGLGGRAHPVSVKPPSQQLVSAVDVHTTLNRLATAPPSVL